MVQVWWYCICISCHQCLIQLHALLRLFLIASLSPCPLLLPCVALFFIIGRLFSIFYAAAAYQLHGPLRQFRLPLLAPPTHSAAWEVWNAPLCVCVCSVSAAAMLPLLLLLLLLLSSWVASLISSNWAFNLPQQVSQFMPPLARGCWGATRTSLTSTVHSPPPQSQSQLQSQSPTPSPSTTTSHSSTLFSFRLSVIFLTLPLPNNRWQHFLTSRNQMKAKVDGNRQ